MLAVLTLVAILGGGPHPASSALARNSCPAVPVDAVVESARPCDAIEVGGRVDATSIALDPAFDIHAVANEFARPAPGNATISAYDKSGRMLFAFPFTANGPFRLVLPVAPQIAAAITHLTLAANGATFDRAAAPGDVPSADALSVDESHVIFTWDARSYPAIRIADAQNGALIAETQGNQTYQQFDVRTTARRFAVTFSDGVHSYERTVSVFGR